MGNIHACTHGSVAHDAPENAIFNIRIVDFLLSKMVLLELIYNEPLGVDGIAWVV